MNRILLIPALCTVAACATPGVETAQTESALATDATQVAASAPTAAPVKTAAPVQAQAQVTGNDYTISQTTVVQNEVAEGTHGIEDLAAPNVRQTPAEMIPGRVEPEDQIVCERVTPTGSKIPRKVCRDKAEVAKKSQYDQEMFDDIKRNTAIGNSRL